jgi:predicted nucleic acid-binding protein
VLVDTSALLALALAQDAAHGPAVQALERLRAESAELVTTSYVLVETYALLGRRFGLPVVRGFRDHVAPLLTVIWVDANLNEGALDRLLGENLRDLSLVDAVSLEVLRTERIDRVFAFDPHLVRDGARAVA